MSGDVQACVVAAVDQHLARLRDLVRLARDHRDVHDCTAVVPCPGEWAVRGVLALTCQDRFDLLLLAVAELDALGYGLPAAADRIELTDRAREVLGDNDPGRSS